LIEDLNVAIQIVFRGQTFIRPSNGDGAKLSPIVVYLGEQTAQRKRTHPRTDILSGFQYRIELLLPRDAL